MSVLNSKCICGFAKIKYLKFGTDCACRTKSNVCMLSGCFKAKLDSDDYFCNKHWSKLAKEQSVIDEFAESFFR